MTSATGVKISSPIQPRLDARQRDLAHRVARGIAEHLCAIQTPYHDENPASGSIFWIVEKNGTTRIGNNWNHAFAAIGLLTAGRVLNEPRYTQVALSLGKWMKSLQIFNAIPSRHDGGIRELTPQTTWSYPRDAVSVAWGFVELYRHSGDKEYLHRAEKFGQWLLREAIDPEGWPYWGIEFEPYPNPKNPPQICNHIQGSFHGGTLNILLQLAKETGDASWCGAPLTRMADHLVTHIQQPSGFFVSIERATHRPPSSDPQGGLHKINDDLSSLGLLGAYQRTGNRKYLDAVQKFLGAAVAEYREKGGKIHSASASYAVLLNTCLEAWRFVPQPADADFLVGKLIDDLASLQVAEGNPLMIGGLLEDHDGQRVVARGSCYALITLLKLLDPNHAALRCDAI